MEESLKDIFNKYMETSDIAKNRTLELAAGHLGEPWSKFKKEDITITRFFPRNGQSNMLYHVVANSTKLFENTKSPTNFLLRLYGQPARQVLVDSMIFNIFSERKIGPKLYGFFDGGRLEEFIPSRTMNEETVVDLRIARKIGAVYPKYHLIDIPISKNRRVCEIIREWLNEFKAHGGTEHKIVKTFVNYECPNVITVDDISKELDKLQIWTSKFEETVVFSHNDLACGNILEVEKTKEIMLIDWEYASYNYRGFDIAMYLAETTIDYRHAPKAKIDQGLTEYHPLMEPCCRAYINKLYEMKEKDPSMIFPRTNKVEMEIDLLVKECYFFWPITHLFWAVWALKSVQSGYDNGLDLLSIASDRFATYFHLQQRTEDIYKELLLYNIKRMLDEDNPNHPDYIDRNKQAVTM